VHLGGDVGGVDVIRQTRIPVVNGPGQQASADLPIGPDRSSCCATPPAAMPPRASSWR